MMSPNDVQLIQIGRKKWPRWMIIHRSRRRYWFKGRWRKKRRDGDVWAHQANVEEELPLAKLFWQIQGVDDE
jgi:hypothetical protein